MFNGVYGGTPDANEVAPPPRRGIRVMAEKVKDPKVSPADTGFNGCTEIQGTGRRLRTADVYETILAMASRDLRQPLRLIISSQELLARRLTHLERSERASAIGRTVGSSGRRGALVKM
jgi:signal transduction histidine kinase